MPTEAEEDWRYSPIERLDLDAYHPVLAPDAAGPGASSNASEHGRGVNVRNGWPASPLPSVPRGVRVQLASERPDGKEVMGLVEGAGDAFAALHEAFVPDALVVEVDDGVGVDEPIVVVHALEGGYTAAFPQLVIRVGRGSRLQIVELFVGGEGSEPALVVPVTRASVSEEAHLSYVSLQRLGGRSWYLGRLAASVAADAALRAFTAGMGGDYARLQTEVTVHGHSGSSELRSVYLGTGTQVHDLRTLQDHAAPSTASDLLCKGAVGGSSRSIYSGLIRVRPGAVRTEAMQTNHNLVLGDHAHADSVPNLDIEENDVRCSHASTVGPLDADQLYYVESRGVAPQRAEQLIVLGFFEDVIARCPVTSVQDLLRRDLRLRMADLLPAAGNGGGARSTAGKAVRLG